MPQRQTPTNQSHRVVCLCTSYECGDQEYADANGVYHPGVEVLPETRDAHQRADFRNDYVKSPDNTTSYSRQASIDSAQEDLLSPLRLLHIASAPSPSPDSHQLDDQNQTTEDVSTLALPVESSTDDVTNHSPQRSESNPAKTCSQAVLAKSSGHKVFDCDHYHTFELKSMNPLILHVALTAAILDIFGRSSNSITSWILDINHYY
ncbi:uncharacterized protein MELLADRAFT_69636 [Melampsora larici-populina 98AG31]|uniref:Uncharacterized protein n=1 Tax=Melampsora larici-populina (strain 98AG31 / pathotype 3-4-7) TaxID=747676 RepID=F4SBH9_MELLP|nr:uncharacterized protein MELLADRAFT_69636 [Melampsora larici-populina 98AG31]EGF97992.1 hypothetical protein MELLADRAFT_69636 [Melampsora larici-populina 98AG31]